MGLTMVILFPLGAVLMRFVSSKPAKIHQGIQISAIIAMLGAGALGFYLVYLKGGTHFTDFRNCSLKGSNSRPLLWHCDYSSCLPSGGHAIMLCSFYSG